MQDTIVIGAGQAGLGTSYYLKRLGVEHTVLERGRIAESWRSQRWDSFAVNSPNSFNGLPGAPYEGPMPDGFYSRGELVDAYDRYAERYQLPVRTGAKVTSVTRQTDRDCFVLRARTPRGEVTLYTRSVVVAAGWTTVPKTPSFAKKLSPRVSQLHTATYRNPRQLHEGAVVVVGSGQSGCQIAEELAMAGRTVYLCSSRVGRIPRRYRGRDIVEWMNDSGFLDEKRSELDDPGICFQAQPQLSGKGRRGHSLSLQHLAAMGVRLRGGLTGVVGECIRLDDRLPEYVRFADEKSAQIKKRIDEYIEQNGIEAQPPENDAADSPWKNVDPGPDRLDLSAAGVGTVIWCTGFGADFSWLHVPVLDENQRPVHDRGVSIVPGVYFVGFPWLYKRKSGMIHGIKEDGAYIATQAAAHVAKTGNREQRRAA